MNAAKHAHGSAERRIRYSLSTSVLIAAATVACLIAGALATRYAARWDLTATGQYTLSPRTLRVLNTIEGPHTVVVSADRSRLDRRSAERIGDLLGEFARRAPDLRLVWIDTGSASGRQSFTALLGELAEPQSEAIDRQRGALVAIASEITELQRALQSLADTVRELAQPMPDQGEGLERQAGLLRALASRLDPALAGVYEAADASVAGVSLPAIDRAKQAAAQPVDEARRAAAAVAEYAGALVDTAPPAAHGAARRLTSSAAAERDRAARIADELARLRPLDPLIVARALEAGDAVLVTGPRGTVAIEFASLFPAGAAGADPAAFFTGEQLVSTALVALNNPRTPIVVFVHAENAALLDRVGAPTPLGRRVFGALFDRMRLMRSDIVEWPVASQPVRPDLAALNPRGDRPVVYVVFGAPTRAALDPRQADLIAEHARRVDRLGQVVSALMAGNNPFLLCVEPSDRPAIGEADPCIAPLVPLGIRVDSARPLLRRESSPSGQLTFTHHVLRRAETDSPIGAAIDGLGVGLSWASTITLDEQASGARLAPVLRVPASDGAWGESQWMLLRTAVARGLARPFEGVVLADPPTPTPGRDATEAPAGGWIVAATAERPRGAGAAPHRVVVVASPSWFDDQHAASTQDVAGRRVRLFPGNAELFDASVLWLSGLDEFIAPGPQVRDIPRIGRIEPGALTALRWLLIAGLPVGVLILGALLRLVRG